MRFAVIDENRRRYPVAMMCRLLAVSPSGFYASRRRSPSERRREDHRLKERVVALHTASRGTYGSPRIRLDLAEEGFQVGRRRISRLMREAGIEGVHRRRFRSLTRRNEAHPVAENVLRGDFSAERPNNRWVADITYVDTDQGWLYLAVVLDLFSRSVVGWSMAETLHTRIVTDALRMALARREAPRGVVHHSDRGCQYTSRAFRAELRQRGVICSMGSTGSCFDNAAAESFFATLKTECVYRERFATRDHARAVLFDYIESFYNRQRRHSSAGGLSPAAYERLHAARLAA